MASRGDWQPDDSEYVHELDDEDERYGMRVPLLGLLGVFSFLGLSTFILSSMSGSLG